MTAEEGYVTVVSGFLGGVLGAVFVLFIRAAYTKLRNVHSARITHRKWEAQRARLRKRKNVSTIKS